MSGRGGAPSVFTERTSGLACVLASASESAHAYVALQCEAKFRRAPLAKLALACEHETHAARGVASRVLCRCCRRAEAGAIAAAASPDRIGPLLRIAYSLAPPAPHRPGWKPVPLFPGLRAQPHRSPSAAGLSPRPRYDAGGRACCTHAAAPPPAAWRGRSQHDHERALGSRAPALRTAHRWLRGSADAVAWRRPWLRLAGRLREAVHDRRSCGRSCLPETLRQSTQDRGVRRPA